MKEEKKVCENCGNIDVFYTMAHMYDLNTHEDLGASKWQEEENFYYCMICQEETTVIPENEWKALNRNNKINEILED